MRAVDARGRAVSEGRRRLLRALADADRAEVARKLGVTRTAVTKWLTGAVVPSLKIAVAIELRWPSIPAKAWLASPGSMPDTPPPPPTPATARKRISPWAKLELLGQLVFWRSE